MFGDLRQKQRAEDCGEGGSEGCCVGLRSGSWEDQLCDRTAVLAAHGGVGSRRKVDDHTEIFKQGDYCAGCTGGGMQWAGERREDFGLGANVKFVNGRQSHLVNITSASYSRHVW